MNASGAARKRAEALRLDVDTIATALFGEGSLKVLSKEDVEKYAAQSTSQAAATCDPDPDPLWLDGCTINIKWPRKGETRDRTGIVRFQPLQGKKRRYVVLMERRGGTREMKTNWRKLKRRWYEVVSSPYKKKGHRWTDTELEAAKRRRGRQCVSRTRASACRSTGRRARCKTS